jgi:NAD(P)-dependent dehydrogenase (short-subunit alcohol dehydrogenase family)
MSMFDLTGDVAIVTGGNGGVGLAFARGLVKCGAKVAIWCRNDAKNTSAVEELTALGGDVEAFKVDVTVPAQVEAAFQKTIDRFGKVDTCFANAGGGGVEGFPTKRIVRLG